MCPFIVRIKISEPRRKVDFSFLVISNSRVILSKEQLEKDHFKVRDESKEDAFASQTAEIKKLNHSSVELQYRSFLRYDQMFFGKVGCARLVQDTQFGKNFPETPDKF